MPLIEKRSDVCTVVVTVDAAPALMSVYAEHVHVGLERFSTFPGSLGGALHLSDDQGRVVQYLQWSSEPEYQACIDDPIWDDLASTKTFMDAVHTGQALVDVRIFKVEATSEGSGKLL
jgi:hypothetical protein